jgi:hypothetical protein
MKLPSLWILMLALLALVPGEGGIAPQGSREELVTITFNARGPDKRPHYSVSRDVESMYFTLLREQFLQLARARRVKTQLDGVDSDLTDAQVKRLQAFAKELQYPCRAICNH